METRCLLTPLVSGETVLAAIDTPADIDTFTFDANAGDSIQLNFDNGTIPSTNGIMELFAPGGSPIDVNGTGTGNASEGSYATEVYGLPATGTYTVTVRNIESDAPGDYGLTFVKIGASHQ
ncbi:MAG: PPC domain-containing protein, partial [Planctomycetaceae bacterium]|nr:PPC domain-containing protein [Planctomycetaceae bacterium]